jgi:hypothetical protein
MDDLAAYFDLLGEDMQLSGSPVRGIFNTQGEVVLDGFQTNATTAEVPATAAAAQGQTLVRSGTSYRIRQVLPQAPDGAIHLLVLAKA